jgi:hypothetical protein
MLSSFMLVPEPGIVVAVISNIAFADTPSIARSLAETFVEHARGPARK